MIARLLARFADIVLRHECEGLRQQLGVELGRRNRLTHLVRVQRVHIAEIEADRAHLADVNREISGERSTLRMALAEAARDA